MGIAGRSSEDLAAVATGGGNVPATTLRVFAGAGNKVPEGGRLVVDVGETTIGIFRAGGKLYAYFNACAHQGGPVCQGKIIPRIDEVIEPGGESRGFTFDEANLHIVCPWHGFEYNIQTGAHPGRRSARLISVPVEETTDGIYVTV